MTQRRRGAPGVTMSITQTLFSFDGRMRRRDFWLYTIGVAILFSVLFNVAAAGPNQYGPSPKGIGGSEAFA